MDDETVEFLVKAVGVLIYLALCVVLLIFVTWPLLAFTTVVGGVLGVVAGVVVVGDALGGFGGLGPQPHRVEPADAMAGRWLPATRSAFPRDPAWPLYLAAQWRSDLTQAAHNVRDVIRSVWAWARLTTLAYQLYWGWPLLILPAVLLAAATAAGGVAAAVGLALCALLLVVPAGIALLFAGVLRGWDRGMRLRRGARATCPYPGCNEVSDLPVFVCTCGAAHRDLRPGLLGVTHRRCRCGELLPTTVLRASRKLTVRCPRCDRPLHAGAGGVTEIRIPVIGPASAGKTRFVHAAMTALELDLVAAGGMFAPADATSERVFAEGSALVKQQHDTTKTPSDRSPAAISVEVRTAAQQQAIVHLFDPAGELLAVRSSGERLPFLDEAQGFVLVIDPFSIPAVAERLSDQLSSAHPALDHPDHSYDVTIQRLRDRGVRLERRLLAVTVVKADLLRERPSDVRQWLCDQDLDGLVLTLERDFGQVRYFLVSSWTGWNPADALTTLPPLGWLTAQSGLGVPARAVASEQEAHP